jgi:hypothetical protein
MHKIFEDPTYDEDGIMADEDVNAEWEAAFPSATREELNAMLEELDPFNTINS